MTWIQVLTIVISNFGLMLTLFLWLRKEANADRKEFTAGMNAFRSEWAKESKDFHGRLVSLEERAKA